jgi:hypothetical protein
MEKRVIAHNLIRLLLCVIFMTFCVLSVNAFAQTNDAEKTDDAKKDAKKDDVEDVSGWRIKDYQPYIKAMRDIEKLNVKYADDMLKMANDEYSRGIDLLEDMENDIKKIIDNNKRGKHLNERWHWQEIDRNNQVHRQVYQRKQEAKMKAVPLFVKSIRHLDEIEDNHKEYITQKPEFKTFKIKLYQVYISTQYDLHNFNQCIPLLERFIRIDDITKDDVWAYRYLSSCYAYKETVLTKYKMSNEDDKAFCKQKKNEYLLIAIKLKYGVKSPEYKNIKERIEKDEMKSEVLNEFK